VVVSDRIVTGQNPASAAALARTIMLQLGDAAIGGTRVGSVSDTAAGLQVPAAGSSASQFPDMDANAGGASGPSAALMGLKSGAIATASIVGGGGGGLPGDGGVMMGAINRGAGGSM